MMQSMRFGIMCLTAMAGAAHAQGANPGRDLAAACANCHGTDGHARGDTIKPLAGVPAGKIIAALADFKSGATSATIMQQIAKGYSDGQIKAIAAYFAAQPAAR